MMKRTLFVLGLTAVLITLFSLSVSAGDLGTRYVVVFVNDQIPSDAAQLVEAAGGMLVKTFPETGVGIAVSDNPDFASSLKSSATIESVSQERTRTLPERKAYARTLTAPTLEDNLFDLQWNIRRVNVDRAWEITTGSHMTVVAVIDTGIAWNHPDLLRNVVHSACSSSAGFCGGLPSVRLISDCKRTCSVYPDLDPHGTLVAGVIAAQFGGGRIVGVGPNLGLASYNVFEITPKQEFTALDSSVWAAMLDAAYKGFRVINLSLGDLVFSPDDLATIEAWNRVVSKVIQKGVTIVASAGNEGRDLSDQADHIPSDLPGVISVGATGIRPEPLFPQKGAFDVLAFYSNFGSPIDLVAPGGDCGTDESCPQDLNLVPPNWFEFGILSTFVCPGCRIEVPSPFSNADVINAEFKNDQKCIAEADCQVNYTWAIGTSFSAPHVAAVAGLILDRHPYLDPFEVTQILRRTAERIGDPQLFGSGMLDAYRAVRGE